MEAVIVRMDGNLKRKLRVEAAEQEQSMSGLVKEIIEDYLEEDEPETQPKTQAKSKTQQQSKPKEKPKVKQGKLKGEGTPDDPFVSENDAKWIEFEEENWYYNEKEDEWISDSKSVMSHEEMEEIFYE